MRLCRHLRFPSPGPRPGRELPPAASAAPSLSPAALFYFGACRFSCWLSRYRCLSPACSQRPSLGSLVLRVSRELDGTDGTLIILAGFLFKVLSGRE